jgi:glycosyltransferase involved in cell wall biosynthesis
MASGVPIVSTNVGGIPYLVRDGETALLVPAGDPDAMARATTQLLGDVELYRRLRAGGLNAAQAYTWERVRVRLFDVYERALSALVPEECPS